MLTLGIIDANSKNAKEESFIDPVVSVVGQWLQWECEQAGVTLVGPEESDVVLLVFAGQVDFLTECRKAMKRKGIEPYRAARLSGKAKGRTPYVITGDPVDVAPFTALALADALAIGEGYLFIRQVLDIVKGGGDIGDLRAFVSDYAHAIEGSQIDQIPRDTERPWRLAELTAPIASPDDWVDWDANPLIRTDDKVIRIVASKGCHLKCKFCATTYRQTYRVNENSEQTLTAVDGAQSRGEGLSLITNDVGVLPTLPEIARRGQLAFQSLTVKSLREPHMLATILRANMKISRFGVEGISERIRQAFGKPVSNNELIDMLGQMHSANLDSHLFFIVGAPYETAEDWAEYRDFHQKLALKLRSHLCRIKMTAFNAQPPTPLAYFIAGREYHTLADEWLTWLLHNLKSRHVMYVMPRKPESRLQDLGDSFGVSPAIMGALVQDQGTIDLAPTVEDAYYMPWEIIQWPLATAKRWHLSRSYMRYMGALAHA